MEENAMYIVHVMNEYDEKKMNYVDQWANVSSVHFLWSHLARSLRFFHHFLFCSFSIWSKWLSRVYNLLIYNFIRIFSHVYFFPFGWMCKHTHCMLLTQTCTVRTHIGTNFTATCVHEYSLARVFRYGTKIGHLPDHLVESMRANEFLDWKWIFFIHFIYAQWQTKP